MEYMGFYLLSMHNPGQMQSISIYFFVWMGSGGVFQPHFKNSAAFEVFSAALGTPPHKVHCRA